MWADIEFFMALSTTARGKQAICDHHLCQMHTYPPKWKLAIGIE